MVAAESLVAAPDGEQCDVTIYRAATGSIQTFTLRAGGVLRIGRGVANDIVLDFNGVSVYHAELYLRPAGEGDGPGGAMLCIRDDSKNGTGVRPGPHAPDADLKKPPAWEALQKGALRVLDHGWQIIVPMRSRKENAQLPESWRVLTVYTGAKIGPLGHDDELDGEMWEPTVALAPQAGVLSAKVLDEDDDQNRRKDKKREKKERKERDKRAQEEREARERQEKDEEEQEERKRDKKAKKAAKKAKKQVSDDEGAEVEVKDSEQRELKKKKKDKKDKKKQKEVEVDESAERDNEKEAGTGAEDRAVQARDREALERVAYLSQLDRARREREEHEGGKDGGRKQKDREERERLEQELEAELAEGLGSKVKKKDTEKKGDDEAPATLVPTSPAPGAPTSPAPAAAEPTSPAGAIAIEATSPAPMPAEAEAPATVAPTSPAAGEPTSLAPPLAEPTSPAAIAIEATSPAPMPVEESEGKADDEAAATLAPTSAAPGAPTSPAPPAVEPTSLAGPLTEATSPAPMPVEESKVADTTGVAGGGVEASLPDEAARAAAEEKQTVEEKPPEGEAAAETRDEQAAAEAAAKSKDPKLASETAGDRTEVAPTEGGVSDAEALAAAGEGDAGAGLTAAALAEHSKAMPPIGGEAAGAEATDGRFSIAPSAIASAAAPTTVGPDAGLTAEALAKHSKRMPPIGGEEDAAAAQSGVEGKSVAGKSLGGGTEMTFRTYNTHMTTRSLVVGASVMRELMRSVSPISEPGVNVKRRRRPRSPPPISETVEEVPPKERDDTPDRRRKKKKKDKKEKRKAAPETGGAKKTQKAGRAVSTSHWRASSPTPFSRAGDPSATPGGAASVAPASGGGPSHWQAASESMEPPRVPIRRVAGKGVKPLRRTMISPCTNSPSVAREPPRMKVRLKKRAEGEEPLVGGARPKKRAKDTADKAKEKEAKRRKRSPSKERRR